MARKKVVALPSSIHSVLAAAKAKDEADAKTIATRNAHFEESQRAYYAWVKLVPFDDAMSDQDWSKFVPLLLDLGTFLKTDILKSRIADLKTDDGVPAKEVAIAMLRYSVAGEQMPLEALRKACVSAGSIAYDVGYWIRLGLMKEVLRIEEPREPTEAEASAAAELCELIGVAPPPKSAKPDPKPDETRVLEHDSVQRERRLNGETLQEVIPRQPDPWKSAPFDCAFRSSDRKVKRANMIKELTPTHWAIFTAACAAFPDAYDNGVLKNSYPSDWDSRYVATHALNQTLAEIGLRVKNRKLIAIQKP
jgi:hypothetical protein